MRKSVFPILLIAFLSVASSCSTLGTPADSSPFIMGEKVIEFNSREEDNKTSWASNGYSNEGMFRSVWSHDRVRDEDGIGYLSILDKDGTNYGAEIRTIQGYLYGYFGARIKTFKHSGTVQSLFTYNGGRYTWDEIDIEFLGKDTTKVQFNYYHDGVGGHEKYYDLGFDSSLEFHDYGFKWDKDKITWYIDFKPVYEVNASLGQWGFFHANVWAATSSVTDWTGPYEETNVPLETAYDYFCYAPIEG